MKKFSFLYYYIMLIILLIFFTKCKSSDSDNIPSAGSSTGTGVYFIGHSMVNHTMPGYFKWLLDSSGMIDVKVQRQIIGGATLATNYQMHDFNQDTYNADRDPNKIHGPYYDPGPPEENLWAFMSIPVLFRLKKF